MSVFTAAIVRRGAVSRSALRSVSSAALMATLLLASGASGKECSPKDAEAADASVDTLASWPKVEQAWKRYAHCDSGSIAEGNSEAIARLLVDHWETLPQLDSAIRRTPALKRFVLRHLDTTLDTRDLETIRDKATSSCPAAHSSLCSELRLAAETSLRNGQ